MASTRRKRTSRPGRRPAAGRGRPSLLLIGLAAGFVLLPALLWLGDAVTRPAIGGPFSLVAGDGRTVTDRDLRGRFLLIYFGYTNCPDVCPTTLAEVSAALDRLGPLADRVQPVLITVDPERDTPAVLAPYAAAFSPRLIGLTGSPAAIADVEREYRVYAAIRRTGGRPGAYSVDHSSVLYLMAPDGGLVAQLPADAKAPVLAAELRRRIS